MSLTDKSFNETYRQSLSSNDLYNIELATNFIKQSSFYNTTLDNTNAFNPDKKQYEDRYVYLDSFTNNREFYDKNLKVDTKLSNDIANFATGFAKGGINLVKDTITGVYYLVSNPKEFVNVLANIPNIPSEIKEGIDKGNLDVVLGDYESVTARDFEFIAGLTSSSAITNKAGKAVWDRFGDVALKPIDDIVDSFSKYPVANIADAGKIAETLDKIEKISVNQIINSAQEAYKGSTIVGHALSKHAGRKPEIWGKTTGSMDTWNLQGMKHLKDILNSNIEFKKVTNSKGITFLEKRLPDGRGVRLELNGNFKGFID